MNKSMKQFEELQAVIWDMDGVLLNSNPFHFDAWRQIFVRHHWIIPDETLLNSYGMTNDQVIRSFNVGLLDQETIAAISLEKEEIFRKSITANVEFLPGVQHWLQEFKDHGVKQALASSGCWENINAVLDALHARQYMDAVVSGEGGPSKPAPDVFLQAAGRLSVSPEHCMVVEDAIVGVKAAKAAGMKCLAVTTSHPAERLKEADKVVHDMTELTDGMVRNMFAHLD
jgi:beta-phosphoglucomutase